MIDFRDSMLTDARNGLLRQTRRHARIAALMGIPRVILAVNKMGLVEFDSSVFKAIAAEFSCSHLHLAL